MNANRFTQKTIEAVQAAQSLAKGYGNQQLEQEHVLLALLEQEGGLIPQLLVREGVNTETLSERLEQTIGRLPKVSGGSGETYLSRDMIRPSRRPKRRLQRCTMNTCR